MAAVTAPASGLYIGWVRHRRHRPRSNAFRYRTYHVLIDLDELYELDRDVRGFGYRRSAPVSFHDVDHLGPGDIPSREKLRRILISRGLAMPDGPVRVLTDLRVLGFVFSPVSWWFCHDRDGSITMIVAEVHNTFGEVYAYVLDDLMHGPGGRITASSTKAFHVSPFLPIEGLTYRFTFVIGSERVTVHMDVDDEHGRLLDATQSGRRRPIASPELARTLVSHPLMTLRTVALIHLQAVRLWFKQVPFFSKPSRPPGLHDVSGSSSLRKVRS